MPIKVAVENRDELRLIVYRYSGHIDQASVLASVTHGVSHFASHQPYRELLIFEHDTDLSGLNAEALTALHRKCEDLHQALNPGSRTAAAMVDNSADAKMIMPLFNALSLKAGGTDFGFELFAEVEPALRRLGVAVEEGLKIAARAT